ncbi:phospholipase D family protein [Anaerobacillus sp. MEB173]|uniref:phospholipase D family protein n=1 Tax=Anaerobacillus sp. MEB173 TaxID=3383345 RepID=UPI003F90A61A
MGSPFIPVRTSKRFNIKKIVRNVIFTFLIIILLHSIYGYFKPLPNGLSVEGDIHQGDVEFLYDLTYESDNGIMKEQSIFERIHSLIDEADDFIIVDMFLFNDEYDRAFEYPTVSNDLVQALIEKKGEQPEVEIVVITDPINTFYGSYSPDSFQQLEQAGIYIVYTDLASLRDSNPVYSGFWRSVMKWFGKSEDGWLPSPFSPDSPNVTLRSYFDLLNFKANHRKVVITEKEAVVTSANPHDASGNHSNIAFALKGKIIEDLIRSEKAVVSMSGTDDELFDRLQIKDETAKDEEQAGLQLVTEGEIREHLLREIDEAVEGDTIYVGAFYLSDRKVIRKLLDAAEQNVTIRLILDANKDAFGREKNGVPNRPVAYELIKKSKQKIEVRWYNTNGEQYHTKLVMIDKGEEAVLIGGSANFTKRNLGDLNLESNVKVTGSAELIIMQQARDYFEMLWRNEGANYTLDYEDYKDDSLMSRFLYRFQEWSGISSF